MIASVAKRELAIPASTVLAVLGLFVTIWITIEVTLARGPVFSFLKALPPLRSLHLNYRFAAAFILPLSILGAMILERWLSTNRRQLAAVILVVATCAGPLTYFALPEAVHRRGFDLTQSLDDHQRIVRGERFIVKFISSRPDPDTFSTAASSSKPYEPLFGYDLEMFRPKFREGDVTAEIDGRFNMTNPVSLVFPQHTGTEPFDLIPTTDRVNFDRLRSREQPHWPLPPELVWLNRLAVVSLLLCFAILGAEVRRKQIGSRNKPPN